MKKLKFMLAAAAAIGLSTASQAEYYPGSTNFEGEDYVAGASVTSAMNSLFVVPADSESTIVGEAVSFAGERPFQYRNSAATKYMQVSTGTDPLLCNIRNVAQDVGTGSIYVDTLVQFTVTPETDNVETNGTSDKLLIYLKETSEDVNGETTVSTNLMVKAAAYVKDSEDPQYDTFTEAAVPVTNAVVAGAWYRLTVKAYKDADDVLLFNIFIDGNPVAYAGNTTLYVGDADLVVFPSLLGRSDTSIAAVGFAGEGKVDDLSFTNSDPLNTSVDFSLTWGSSYSPVSYTIGSGAGVSLVGATGTSTNIPVTIGDSVKFVIANADGATKTLTGTAGSEAGQVAGLDASSETFTWADYLGEADGTGAYVIDNLEELVLFKKGVAKFGTSGLTFKLGADIDASSLGYFDGIGTASGTNGSSGLNNCTFDGAGKTISNVKFTPAKYRGFFNQVLNSTIKDLTINVVDIQQTSAAEHGYSAFAGNMKNSKILNCVATGTLGTTAKPTMHTCGGFAVKSSGGNVFENCSNDVDIVCSLTDNPKIGGIVGLVQEGAAALTNCWNSGDITITCKTCDNAGNGAGGLVGYAQSALTIHGGGNAGTVQSTDTTAHSGSAAIKVGTIIAMQNSSTATVTGGVVAQADAAPAGAFANVSGLNFATVSDNVATFVADGDLAAGNTYKVMNTAATATYQFTAVGTIAFDTALATPTYAITAASGLAADSYTAGNVKTYYAIDWAPAPAAHAWYESPKAVVLAENLPGQTGNIVSAFHGQGESEYLGLTYSTNPLQFDLYQVDGTNALTTLRQIPVGETGAGFRGVAISKILGIAVTLRYATTTKMLAYPLNGGDSFEVTPDTAIAFDAAAFSPDGKYLFSNAVEGDGGQSYYVKWAVSNGGATLTRVGSINAGGRARSLAYGRINGRDLVFGLVDTGKVAVIDMTGDDSSAWTATDLITDLPKHSYGTLCISGVKVTGGTPHLTVATSFNDGATKSDVLNVYALTVPASGAVSATLTKSFDEDALTAAGFGDISDANRYGNTVYVTEDEATIYFARPDNKLYAAQYAAPAPAGEELAPGEQSSTTYSTQADAEAAAANVTIAASDAVEAALVDTTSYLQNFEAKVVEVEGGSYKVEVGLTTLAAAALQSEVNADAAEVVEDLDTATVTLTTTPGFYYSFEYGTTLGNMAEVGTRTLATGSTLTLTRPTTANATSGFYKVLVNVTPAE